MNKNVFQNYQMPQEENEEDEEFDTDSGSNWPVNQFSSRRRLGRKIKSTASLKPPENHENPLQLPFSSHSNDAQTHPVNPGAAPTFFKSSSSYKSNLNHAQSIEKILFNNINYRNAEQCKKNLNYDSSIKTPDKQGSLVNSDVLATRKKYPFLVSSQDKENVAPDNGKFKEPLQPKSVFTVNRSSDQDEGLLLFENKKPSNAMLTVSKSNVLYSKSFIHTKEKYKTEKSSCNNFPKPEPRLLNLLSDDPRPEEETLLKVMSEYPKAEPAHEPYIFKDPSPPKALDLSPQEKTDNSDSSQDSSCFETAVMSTSKLNVESPLDLSSHKSYTSMEVTGTLVETPACLDLSLLNFNNDLRPNPNVPSKEERPSVDTRLPSPLVSLPHVSLHPSYQSEIHAHPQKPATTPVRPPSESLSNSQKKNENTPIFKKPLSVNNYKAPPIVNTQESVAKSSVIIPPTSVLKKAAVDKSQDIINIKEKQYQVLGLLGKGGSSSVYVVQETTVSEFKPLALKVVNLSTITDQSTADGYLNEVELLAKLQGCPCVITMHDYEYDTSSKHLYVLMEKGDSDLSKYMRNINKMATIPNTMIIIIKHWYEMLLAVKEIHASGIIHSDLKPANFLFVGGVLKIIDFGIASSLQGDMTSVYKDIASGTLNYMSPESIGQSSTSRTSYKSDVWSLGCILYNMVYGRTPYSHIPNTWVKMQAIANPKNEVEFKTELSSDVAIPPTLLQSMKLCLQKDPKQRPTVVELLGIVESRISAF